MKVVAFNGSAREKGNTSCLIDVVLNELKNEGIETKKIHLGNKPAQGCIACYECYKNKNKHCVLTNDQLNQYLDEMLQADGIILGSPVYCANMSTNMKALIERATVVAKANGNMFKRKLGASVVSVRRGGATHVFSSINYFFLISQMIVPGSNYWNFGIGKDQGDVENDQEGVQTMIELGKNMAWLLKKIKG